MPRALSLLLILLSVLGAACARDDVPALIEVKDVAPREVEVGDKLEVRGAGFPQGRPAHVVLRGLVHQPGRAARRVEIACDGLVTAPDRVELSVNDALESRLCGRGITAAHATFRGDVEVAFSSTVPGAPPLSGLARGVELDARPAARAEAEAEREREGQRVLAFMGVKPGVVSARGVEVIEVRPGSPAEVAGVVASDRITRLDGVRVGQIGDLAGGGGRFVEIGVRRGDGGPEELRTLSMIGYEGGRVPFELAPALAVVLLALAAVFILLRRGPNRLSRAETLLGWAARRATIAGAARALFGSGVAAAGAAVAVSVMLGTFALGPHVLGRELDLPVLWFSSVGLLVTARVLSARGQGSLRHGAVAFVAMFVALLGVALAATAVGAISLVEIVRAQGASPWEWHATRSPALMLVAFGVIAAVLAALRLRPARAIGALSDAPRPEGVAETLERFGVFVASAVIAAVFLGGFRATGDGASVGGQALGALIFVLKAWTVAALLQAARRGLAPLEPRALLRFVILKLTPLVLGAGAAAIALRRFGSGILYEGPAGAVIVSLVALLALRLVLRVQEQMRAPEPRRASPFV